MTRGPASEWQSGYEAGIDAAINALEADAKICDCFAFEDDECACGAWWDYKTIKSERAVEIVRAIKENPPPEGDGGAIQNGASAGVNIHKEQSKWKKI